MAKKPLKATDRRRNKDKSKRPVSHDGEGRAEANGAAPGFALFNDRRQNLGYGRRAR